MSRSRLPSPVDFYNLCSNSTIRIPLATSTSHPQGRRVSPAQDPDSNGLSFPSTLRARSSVTLPIPPCYFSRRNRQCFCFCFGVVASTACAGGCRLHPAESIVTPGGNAFTHLPGPAYVGLFFIRCRLARPCRSRPGGRTKTSSLCQSGGSSTSSFARHPLQLVFFFYAGNAHPFFISRSWSTLRSSSVPAVATPSAPFVPFIGSISDK